MSKGLAPGAKVPGFILTASIGAPGNSRNPSTRSLAPAAQDLGKLKAIHDADIKNNEITGFVIEHQSRLAAFSQFQHKP